MLQLERFRGNECGAAASTIFKLLEFHCSECKGASPLDFRSTLLGSYTVVYAFRSFLELSDCVPCCFSEPED